MKKLRMPSIDEGHGTSGPPTVDGSLKWYEHFGKMCGRSYCIHAHPNTQLYHSSVYTQQKQKNMHQWTTTVTLLTTLFMTAKNSKKCI